MLRIIFFGCGKNILFVYLKFREEFRSVLRSRESSERKRTIQRTQVSVKMVEKKAAEDYAKLFQSISLDKEVNPIYMNIEDMLARLDELETLLANVKAENNIIVDQYTNNIVGFAKEFRILKERIDTLENFVGLVNNNVDEVEKSLDIAENELNITDYSLKGLIFKPFLSKSKSSNQVSLDSSIEETIIPSNIKNNEFHPVQIFKTDNYFK